MKKKKIWFNLISVILIGIIGIALMIVAFKNLKFGLDLQGGFEVLYEVKSLDDDVVTSDMVLNTYKSILKRIDALGVSEPNITIEGDNKIRVQLAGVKDSAGARDLLSKTANLTFRDTSDNLLATSDILKSGGAKLSTDEYMNYVVSLGIADNEKFYNMTKNISQMSDNRIVIWLDYSEGDSFKREEANCGSLSNSKCISAAYVREAFSSDVIIQGNFTKEEATTLVELINSGSLPTKLEEISSRSVEASFGVDALDKTFKAGIIGIILIVLFLIIIYRFSGFISSIGIILYTTITLGLFWLIGGVLTLPGIAAMVIGIGMAVDASVITFSRIKDELDNDKKLKEAYELGNKNSFKAILDGNLTTLIAAIILFIFGESSVKGFATVLIISTIVTMLIMVLVIRLLLKGFIKSNYFNTKLSLFIGYKKSNQNKLKINISFNKIRNITYVAYAVIFIIGIILGIKNGLTLGIDFKGGSSITIESNNKIDSIELENLINSYNYEINNIEILDDTSYVIKINDTLNKDDVKTLENELSDKYEAKTSIDVISNVVKKELISNALISIVLVFVGIIIYVSFRFSFNYALSSMIAIILDVLVTLFIFIIFKIEISTIFIAAILSIIGYSINDTIVTFDRIKENLNNKKINKLKSSEELLEIIKDGLKNVLSRSIYTTLTTLLPIIMLILIGSKEILNFNMAMLIGLISGLLSSLVVAPTIWYLLEKRNIGKPDKKKWYEEDEAEEISYKGINC